MSQKARMLRSSINLTKLDSAKVFTAKDGRVYLDINDCTREYEAGRYLDLTLYVDDSPHPEYGTVGSVVQDIGKERREAGDKGPKIGNLKEINPPGRDRDATNSYKGQQTTPPADDDGDDIPF